MSCDRIIRWNGPLPRPPQEEVEKALKGYLGLAGKVNWDGERYFAYLHGVTSDPFPGFPRPYEQRFFEVWMDDTSIDVITRQADEFTMVVAEGFAVLVARYWQGVRDDD